jgi:hypothetical protein
MNVFVKHKGKEYSFLPFLKGREADSLGLVSRNKLSARNRL